MKLSVFRSGILIAVGLLYVVSAMPTTITTTPPVTTTPAETTTLAPACIQGDTRTANCRVHVCDGGEWIPSFYLISPQCCQQKCSSGSCQAVTTRRGAVVCVKQPSKVIQETPAVKSQKTERKKKQHCFEFPRMSLKNISLTEKGLDVGSLRHMLVELKSFSCLYAKFGTADQCTSLIRLGHETRRKYITVTAKSCKHKYIDKRKYVMVKGKVFFKMYWTSEMVSVGVCHPMKDSRKFIREVIKICYVITDLTVNALGRRLFSGLHDSHVFNYGSVYASQKKLRVKPTFLHDIFTDDEPLRGCGLVAHKGLLHFRFGSSKEQNNFSDEPTSSIQNIKIFLNLSFF